MTTSNKDTEMIADFKILMGILVCILHAHQDASRYAIVVFRSSGGYAREGLPDERCE